MIVLVAGLVLFLGVHSLRVFAEGWRGAQLARLGERPFKGLYAIASLAGFALVVWGYGLARQEPVALWTPPTWTRHLAGVLMLVSFVLVAAAYVPGNGIKARWHHPLTLAVKTWALAHLLANGTLADALLFGAFLVWAVRVYRAARQRDRAAGTTYAPGTASRTAAAVGAGVVGWAVFAGWLHGALIGVRPFG